MNRYQALSAATVTLSLALVSTGCSALGIGGAELSSGEALRAATPTPRGGTPEADGGWTAELQLPDGRLTARVAPLSTKDIPADATFEHTSASVDGDSTLVAVSWHVDAFAGVPLVARELVLSVDGVEDRVSLVSGGTTIPLDVDGLDHNDGFAYAAVPDPDDLTFEVDFDGVAQSITADSEAPHVDPAARPLYDPGADRTSAFADCRRSVTPASLARTGLAMCQAQSAQWPWVLDGGWAHEGAWRIVRLQTALEGRSSAPVTDVRVRATVDGAEPRSTTDDGSGASGTTALMVFDPGTRLDVVQTSKVAGRSARLTGRLDLG